METKTMLLPVHLTPEEVRLRGEELARKRLAQLANENAKKAAAKQYKAVDDALQLEINDLARAVDKKSEMRQVEIREVIHVWEGTAEIFRCDTGALVSSRALTESEMQREYKTTRQPSLFTDDGRPAGPPSTAAPEAEEEEPQAAEDAPSGAADQVPAEAPALAAETAPEPVPGAPEVAGAPGAAVEALCQRCKGTGKVPSVCDDPQCGDSTWDHECNLGGEDPCSDCKGTGKLQPPASPHVHTRDCYDDPGPGHGSPFLICGQLTAEEMGKARKLELPPAPAPRSEADIRADIDTLLEERGLVLEDDAGAGVEAIDQKIATLEKELEAVSATTATPTATACEVMGCNDPETGRARAALPGSSRCALHVEARATAESATAAPEAAETATSSSATTATAEKVVSKTSAPRMGRTKKGCTCPRCDKAFAGSSQLYEHLMVSHGLQSARARGLADEHWSVYQQEAEAKKAKRAGVKATAKAEAGVKPGCPCPRCDNVMDSQKSLEKHLAKFHGALPTLAKSESAGAWAIHEQKLAQASK